MLKKELIRLKRHRTIRLKMHGTSSRPRLVVRRSLSHFYVQLIDDTESKILLSLSTNCKEIKQKILSGGNVKAAQFLGEQFAAKTKEKNITKVLFDRAGYLYHGRIKAFADAARKAGLEF